MSRFEGKTIMITGGTSGIGFAGAERLVAEGARVVVTGRTEEHLRAAAELGPAVRAERDDAGDPDSPARLARVAAEEGGLDGLWLNAGYAAMAPVEELDRGEVDELFAVNVVAPMMQLGALSPHLKPGAAMLVTSSTASYEGGAGLSLYSATKSALLAAARCWATELAPRGIRVNSIVPGPITSRLRSALPEDQRDEFENALAAQVLLGRVGDAAEAAALAAFLLSDDSSYITGSSHLVDGGMLLR